MDCCGGYTLDVVDDVDDDDDDEGCHCHSHCDSYGSIGSSKRAKIMHTHHTNSTKNENKSVHTSHCTFARHSVDRLVALLRITISNTHTHTLFSRKRVDVCEGIQM